MAPIERPDWNGDPASASGALVPVSGVPATSDAGLTPAIVPDGWVQALSGDQSAPVLDGGTLQEWRDDGTAEMFLGIVDHVASLSSPSDAAAVESNFGKMPPATQRRLLEIVRNRRPAAEHFERWFDRELYGKLTLAESAAVDTFIASLTANQWRALVGAICRERRR